MKKKLVSTSFILLALMPFLFGNFNWNQNFSEHQASEDDLLNDNASTHQKCIVIEDAILMMEEEASVSNSITFEEDEIEDWDELEFITIHSQHPKLEDNKLLSRLNPFQNFATLELKTAVKKGEFKLFDQMGVLILKQNFSGSKFEIQRNELQSGNYFYTISDNGQAINAGKMIIN